MLANISISEPKSIHGIMKMLKTLENFEHTDTVEAVETLESFDILKTLKILNNAVNSLCPPHYYRYANGCYLTSDYMGGQKQWDSARLYCQATAGDLATSMLDNLPLFSIIYNIYYTRWIGAYREGDEILFLNGTVLPTNSSLWDEGYPIKKDGSPSYGNCVYLSSSYKLRTDNCGSTAYFFCQSGV